MERNEYSVSLTFRFYYVIIIYMAIKSDNTQGNPYHSEEDGKFTSADNNDSSKKPKAPPYKKFLDNKVPFSHWNRNAKNHFIDDKLVMPYFEQNILPKIMEQYDFQSWSSRVGTKEDKQGIDYVFMDKSGGLIKVDLKNVASAFGGEINFNNASVSLRLKQTVWKDGRLKLVDGFVLNEKHLDDKVFITCLNTDDRMRGLGEKLLQGEQPNIKGHYFFTIDSHDLRNSVYKNFYGRDGLNALVTGNLKGLIKNINYFQDKGYDITMKNGMPSHIVIPISKIGNLDSEGAQFAYDITYDAFGNPNRYTCNLIIPKSLASSKNLFKTAKVY